MTSSLHLPAEWLTEHAPAAGEQGQWRLAETIFSELEGEMLRDSAPPTPSSSSRASLDTPLQQLVLNPSAIGALTLPTAPGDIWGLERPSHWGDDSSSPADTPVSIPIPVPMHMNLPGSSSSEAGSDILSSGSFGEMPKLLAEQVCASPGSAAVIRTQEQKAGP